MSHPRKPLSERDQTDKSLRTERKNTDAVIDDRSATDQETADQLVQQARDQADAVLDTARGKADQKLESLTHRAGEREAVSAERAKEDQVLEEERATADEVLRRERQEEARVLAKLLPIEREKTDRFLLTERSRSDDQLANRDDFLGMVSHDLRNLLSGVLLSAQTVSECAEATTEGTRTRTSMQRIERYVARMNRLIGDLVDVVSIDAGKLAVQRGPVDAAALVTQAVDAFAQAAAERGIAVTAELPTGELSADVDHDRMLQVMANLITNALKFTPQGGTVTIRAERVEDSLLLTVRDTGAGIAAHMLEAVFERFWQVNENDQRGLGLGLYISRCIVTAHDGKIWVESELEKGSSFFVSVPVAGSAVNS